MKGNSKMEQKGHRRERSSEKSSNEQQTSHYAYPLGEYGMQSNRIETTRIRFIVENRMAL